MNAYILSLNEEANLTDQWDFGFLKDFLEDNNFSITNVHKLPNVDKAIVAIPARHHAGLEQEINNQLNNIDHVVLFLMGDEEADFDVNVIDHNSIHIWVQNPHIGKHDKYNKLGTGYPQHMKKYLNRYFKYTDIFFAGQITHQRREELQRVMEDMIERKRSVEFIPTHGFTQGIDKEDYYKHMLEAKIAPAPSGAVIPDSFRLFEALECMTIPIADQKAPSGEVLDYWDWLFEGQVPFPQVQDWDRLYEIHFDILEDYPNNMHKITAWWLMYKRNFKFKVLEQYG